MKLTLKQINVLLHIADYHRRHGFMPSVVDLARNLYVTRNAALCHLVALEKHGAIRTEPGKARSITITEQGRKVLGLGSDKPQAPVMLALPVRDSITNF